MKREISYLKKPRWSCSIFKMIGRNCIPKIYRSPILKEPLWKDKNATPRCECIPQIDIRWLGLNIYLYRGNSAYWERWLWIHRYNNGDEVKAKSTWPWIDPKTGKNSW